MIADQENSRVVADCAVAVSPEGATGRLPTGTESSADAGPKEYRMHLLDAETLQRYHVPHVNPPCRYVVCDELMV